MTTRRRPDTTGRNLPTSAHDDVPRNHLSGDEARAQLHTILAVQARTAAVGGWQIEADLSWPGAGAA